MTTKKRLKQEIDELGYQVIAAQARANKAREEADKAEKRLKSMQLGIAIGEAIGEGWIACSNFTIQQDRGHFNNVPTTVSFSATVDLVGDPNSLMRFGNTLMGR
jgi:hypothetical protein